MVGEDPPREGSLPPGYDENDPYEGVDITTLPDWWRRNIEEFNDHNMRPYRPPRFADGTLTPQLRTELEETFEVSIEIRSSNRPNEANWMILLNGDLLTTVGHYRHGDGYTVFDIDSETVKTLVRESVPTDGNE